MKKDENFNNIEIHLANAFEVQLQLYMTYKYKVNSIDDLISKVVKETINEKIDSGELMVSTNLIKINPPIYLDRATIASLLQIKAARTVGKWEERFLVVSKYVNGIPKYKFKDALCSIIKNTNKERYLYQIRLYLEQFNNVDDVIKLLDEK